MLVRWDSEAMRSLAEVMRSVAADLDLVPAAVAREMQRLGRTPLNLGGTTQAASWSAAAATDLFRRADDLDRAEVTLRELGLVCPSPSLPGVAWQAGLDFDWSLEDLLLDQLGRVRAEQARVVAERGYWWESEADEALAAIVALERRLVELAIEELRIQRGLIALTGAPAADDAAAEFDSMIAYLTFELATTAPSAHFDLARVIGATDEIRSLLDESFFGDVSRMELLEIERVLGSLDPPEFNAVVDRLNDDELYRWFHELDGIRGGNLDLDEEARLFETIARLGDGDTLWRLANAEFGERFVEIADAVTRLAPPPVLISFIARCAETATDSDDAAAAALAGLNRLAPADQQVALVVLADAGLLDPLLVVVDGLMRRVAGERDDPIPIEMLEGLLDGLVAPIKTLGGLTIQGLWDHHAFRRSWSRLGQAWQFLFRDPVGFVKAVIDLDGVIKNPAFWIGGIIPTVVLSFVGGGAAGRLAVAGRLGRRAHYIVTHIDEFVARIRRVAGLRWADEVGAITDPRLAKIAREMGVRIDSLLFERRHLTVDEFIEQFRDGSIRREIPTELLALTVEEAFKLAQARHLDYVRDLLMGSG